MLKKLYPGYRYVSLEDPDQQLRATEDPRSFLKHYDHLVIFDEAQRVPALFSYLQTIVDEDRRPGRYVLSGSQNFLLRNFGKRITKSPKLYFYDTGLLCYLLGMESAADVFRYFQFGALFENLIIADRVKWMQHDGKEARLYFYRDSNQVEVDLLEETAAGLVLTEIKAGRTFHDNMLVNLHRIAKIAGQPVKKQLVFGGDEGFEIQDVRVSPWHDAIPK